ncbi:hypothetical protein D3C72_1569500 [compost metagenome]
MAAVIALEPRLRAQVDRLAGPEALHFHFGAAHEFVAQARAAGSGGGDDPSDDGVAVVQRRLQQAAIREQLAVAPRHQVLGLPLQVLAVHVQEHAVLFHHENRRTQPQDGIELGGGQVGMGFASPGGQHAGIPDSGK